MNDEQEAKEYKQDIELIDALRLYGRRVALRDKLEQIHASMPEGKVVAMPARSWMKYLAISAAAASIAVVSVVATLSVEQKSKAYAPDYVELRRDVAKIQKSQQQMLRNMDSNQNNATRTANYAGTGFLIAAQGYVATSYHVVRDADSVYLENEKFGSLTARVVHTDPQNDVTILQITSAWLPHSVPFRLASRQASLGEKVYTLGFPREDVVFGEGAVSALSGYHQNVNAYQVSIPVNPGNSGGPLLNEKGELIGIISGLQSQTQGAAFAIKSSALLAAAKAPELDTLSKPLVLPQRNSLQSATRVQQIQRLKDFVFMVRVYKN
jgi:serine protease Do